MVSIVEIIFAVRAGFRKAVQITMWPSRTRSVSAASAARDVKDSKVISSVGRGTVWKWSNSQSDSNPSVSACRATSVVRFHASCGSQPSYSPTHPCGMITPSFIHSPPLRLCTVAAMPDITIRRPESDADLAPRHRGRRIVLPDEPIGTVDQLRASESQRVYLLAEVGGDVVGHGVASDSNLADGFAMARVLTEHRRRGFGSALLEAILDIQVAAGRRSLASHAQDDGSLAFAIHHGFDEVDRQVELVRTVGRADLDEPVGPDGRDATSFPGVDFTTVADDPDLLRRAHPLAEQGFADLALTTGPAWISLDEWLREEATLPGGSIVALADGVVVGYAGLVAWNDDDTRAENGLTVVDRAWRGRGLGTALKRRQLAWARSHGIP